MFTRPRIGALILTLLGIGPVVPAFGLPQRSAPGAGRLEPEATPAREWGATGQDADEELERALAELRTFEHGQSRRAWNLVARRVEASLASPDAKARMEGHLLALLDGDTTPACEELACRQLGLVGGDSAVAPLARLLADEKLADLARYALERIPSPLVDVALRDALASAEGDRKVALVSSLGQRGDADSIEVLRPLLWGDDAALTRAAASALVRIGGLEALAALRSKRHLTDVDDRGPEGAQRYEFVTEASLECAFALVERSLADPALDEGDEEPFADGVSGPVAEADAVAATFRDVYSDLAHTPKAEAALRGLVRAHLNQATALVVWALMDESDELVPAAISLVEELRHPAATRRVAALLPQLPGERRALLLGALAAREDPAARTAVLAALGHEDRAVRSAAFAVVPGVARYRTAATLRAVERQLAAGEDQAVSATLTLASSLWRTEPTATERALRGVLAAAEDAEARAAARSLLIRSRLERLALPSLARGALASSPDDLEKDGDAGGDGAAIDGNLDTYWDEVDRQQLYRLRVDLPAPATVAVLTIVGYRHQDYAPRDFAVRCDGREVATVEGARYVDNLLVVELKPVHCSRVEIEISGYYGASPAIRELGLYGPEALADAKPDAPQRVEDER